MVNKHLTYRAYVAKEKRNAELRQIRKEIADFLFRFFMHFTVMLFGIGILFGLYILLATIMGSIMGVNLLESESVAEQRHKEETRIEYTEVQK